MQKSERLKREFVRLVMASNDISAAREGFLHIVENNYTFDDAITRALLAGAIVSYAKPFIGNSDYGSLQGKIIKFENQEFIKIHQQLINSRNKVIAHNDKDHVKILMFPPGATFQVNNESVILDEMSYAVTYSSITYENIEICLKLCSYIEAGLLERIVKIKDILFDNEKIPSAPFVLEY